MSKAVLTEYTVASERVRSPLKIALVSDLHERRALDILSMLKASKPDMIAVAGDTFERFNTSVYVPRVVKSMSFFRRLVLNVLCYINYALTFVFGRRNQSSPQNAYGFSSAWGTMSWSFCKRITTFLNSTIFICWTMRIWKPQSIIIL